jgi:hypothetical protein
MPYTHRGTFSYHADGPRSVYADGSADTGEAIFLNVSDRARIRFAYAFMPEADASVEGRIALRAEISDAAGWSRTFVLQPAEAFEGPSAAASGRLQLDDLRRKLERLHERTGVIRTIYQVILRPDVQIEGTVGGTSYSEEFQPALVLEYDGLVLRYVAQPDAVDDPLNPSVTGAVAGPTSATAATLRIAGRTLPAEPLAIAMVVLAFVAACAAWVLLRAARKASELDVPARIRARFADRLVELQRIPEETTVVIATAAGFERLAVASDGPILEFADRYGVTWLLREGETLYSFRVDTTSEGVVTPDAEFTRFLAGQ